MRSQQFYKKAFQRLEQIDKQSLARWVKELDQENADLQSALHQAREAILMITSEGRVSFVNRAAELMLAIETNLACGHFLHEVVKDPHLASVLQKTTSQAQEIYDEPIQILVPRHLHLRLSVVAIVGEPHKGTSDLNRYLISLIPESSNEQKTKEAYQHERLSSMLTLASGIAHEIGNPLNSINIHLQLLSEQLKKIPAKERGRLSHSVNIVLDETKRLDQIVRHFLRATRRKPIHFQDSNVHDVLNELLSLTKPELDKNKIIVRTDFDAKMPNFLFDVERISQVFMNLVKNAIQAMPMSGTLTITTEENQNQCQITFTDTGKGIDQAALNKIFDAYYTTKEEGTGLGLIIAYQIIREHGGRIEVDSDIGSGTSVHVLLPIRKEKLPLPAPMEDDASESFI